MGSNLIIVRPLVTEILSGVFGTVYSIEGTILFHSRLKSSAHESGLKDISKAEFRIYNSE
jgi:hypothetical protein